MADTSTKINDWAGWDWIEAAVQVFAGGNNTAPAQTQTAPETNYTPWLIGGAVFLAVILMVVTLTKK